MLFLIKILEDKMESNATKLGEYILPPYLDTELTTDIEIRAKIGTITVFLLKDEKKIQVDNENSFLITHGPLYDRLCNKFKDKLI